ncbi:hypothetical protein HG537_0H02330 [Torulaspora globosa]|uniref:DFDF domain-containing protein n=1 Tax=Torulaspora globosa TaxID=48254 RepID=A0A7H9HYH1_9SACH|nr:hypothetical protein HG537_0H02330 [Torulaspora sp. CBS 2947]
MSQYIGKTISLVSVTDNRYVGLLEEIDSEKGTVTLRDVRCFGTEGRKHWGPDEIYPNPTVYRSVKFNGNEVKDLSILDVKLEEVQPVLAPQSQSTQSVQGQVPAAMAGYGVYAPAQPEPVAKPQVVARPEVEPVAAAQHVATQPATQPVPTQPATQPVPTQPATQPVPTRAAAKAQPSLPSQPSQPSIPQEDFDFQSNNAKFATENPGIEVANGPKDHPEFYNKKSSFFDSISTSTDTAGNMRWQEEKAMNIDTFGQASARPRFGRGRGRGARGNRSRGNRGRGNKNGFQTRNSYQDTNQHGQFTSKQQIEF